MITETEKNEIFREVMRGIGSRGGQASAQRLTLEERIERARRAGSAKRTKKPAPEVRSELFVYNTDLKSTFPSGKLLPDKLVVTGPDPADTRSSLAQIDWLKPGDLFIAHNNRGDERSDFWMIATIASPPSAPYRFQGYSGWMRSCEIELGPELVQGILHPAVEAALGLTRYQLNAKVKRAINSFKNEEAEILFDLFFKAYDAELRAKYLAALKK